jgi:hypothetical protein
MRLPVVSVAGLLALALVAGPARAQDEGGLGLDLSGDTEKTEESPSTPESQDAASGDTPTASEVGGLDLRGDSPNAELMPRLVMLGLDTSDRAASAVANKWLVALMRAALGTGQVAVGATFAEARERLAENFDAALRCAEAACMAEPADSLDAELLVTGRLAREGKTWTLRLWTYDRDRNVVEEDVLTGRNPRDPKFQRVSADALARRVAGLARLRGKLKVNVNVPQAVVRAGERTLGVGSIEARLPPGELSLSVEADEYSSFAKTVTLKPGETVVVDARLELNGPAPEGPPDETPGVGVARKASSGPSLFKRPAFYTAVVGLAAVGVGVAMGLGAQGVSDRARDANGDGVLDVTRVEVQDAEKQAQLATILMAGGGAVVGGSVLWLVLVPTKSAPPPSATVGASRGGASTGIHLFAGGSF